MNEPLGERAWMGQGEICNLRLGQGSGGKSSGLLTPRMTAGLAISCPWTPDRLGTAPSPKDLGLGLVPPTLRADWLTLAWTPPPTSNQAVVTMVIGRAAASLEVPGRGKGRRRGTKVRSWSWAGDNPRVPSTYTERGARAPSLLPVKSNALFLGSRG